MKIVGILLATTITLVAVLGVIGLIVSPQSERDLADTEMAALFGRQPDPGGGPPACIGCFSFEVVAKCDLPNECEPCVVTGGGQNNNCASVYTWSTGDNKAYKNTWSSYNDDIWVVDTKACRSEYECAAGVVRLQTLCNGGCNGAALNDCRPCKKGDLVTPHTKPWEDCDYCPN